MTDPSNPTTKPVWILLGLLSKKDGPTELYYSSMSGWRVADTKDEAIGFFIQEIKEEKPGFSIVELTCAELPPETMRRALGLETTK